MVLIVSESTLDAEKEKTLFRIHYGENQVNVTHIGKVFLWLRDFNVLGNMYSNIYSI